MDRRGVPVRLQLRPTRPGEVALPHPNGLAGRRAEGNCTHPVIHRAIPAARPTTTVSSAGTTVAGAALGSRPLRSEEHTSELQSLLRNTSAVICLKKKTNKHNR